MNTSTERMTRLREVVEQLRLTDAEQAAVLARALDEVEGGNRDIASIHVGTTMRLEKFDGDIEPGKKPVEIIERADAI